MRWSICAVLLAAMTGCRAWTLDVDGRIAQRSSQAIDMRPADEGPKMLPEVSPRPMERGSSARAKLGAPILDGGLMLVQATKENLQPDKDKKTPSMMEQLKFQDQVLGLKIEDIKLPSLTQPEEYKKALAKYFPELPALPTLPLAQPGPEGRALMLADLQQIALRTSPVIRQAHLDIASAHGAALQAGLYPNPTVGYEADTIGSGRTQGQQGGFVNQTVKTGGKLSLARAAAQADVQIAEQKLRQAEAEVQTAVRANYFLVLSARTNYEVTRALAELTDRLYHVLYLQLTVGEVAAYEPMQIRVLALQARGQLVQAHNRYVAAWKQLAAAMGVPQMPLSALEGRIDMPVPRYEHDQVLAYVLTNHSDAVAATFGVEKGRHLVRLAEVQPFPDVNVNLVVQRDFTTPPFGTTYNVGVGVPIPLWDRNQGNIQSARAQLQRALQENLRVRNDLTSRVAEVFGRYETQRTMLKLYREQMLPNQVQAFRAAVGRHVADKTVSYYDLVTSQQTLAGLIASYLGALSDQWTSVVDIANLLQTRDLFQMQPLDEVAPIPDLPEFLRPRRLHSR